MKKQAGKVAVLQRRRFLLLPGKAVPHLRQLLLSLMPLLLKLCHRRCGTLLCSLLVTPGCMGRCRYRQGEAGTGMPWGDRRRGTSLW